MNFFVPSIQIRLKFLKGNFERKKSFVSILRRFGSFSFFNLYFSPPLLNSFELNNQKIFLRLEQSNVLLDKKFHGSK